LYIALYNGGTNNYGTIYNYVIDNSFNSSVIYNFENSIHDGENPTSIVYNNYSLFIVSENGAYGYGSFLAINTVNYIPNYIYSFINDPVNGGMPYKLYIDKLNNYLYVLLQSGGTTNNGCIVNINLTAGTSSNIHNVSQNDTFQYLTDILYDPNSGYLYVSSHIGGHYGNGGIFRIKPDGSQFQIVNYFDISKSGTNPVSMTTDNNSNIYIANSAGGSIIDGSQPQGNGTIYKLNTNFQESRIYGNINIYNQLLTTNYQTNSLGINNINPEYNLDVVGNLRVTELNVVQDAQIGDLTGLNVNNGLKLIEFNGYNFKEIKANGNFENSRFDGQLSIDDSNLVIKHLDGLLTLSGDEIAFKLNADVEHANLKKIKLTDQNLKRNDLFVNLERHLL
jgi:hypothetical protein